MNLVINDTGHDIASVDRDFHTLLREQNGSINHFDTITPHLYVPLGTIAQSERKLLREGNDEYNSKKYSEAEVNYKKSLEKNKNSVPGNYNLGNSF